MPDSHSCSYDVNNAWPREEPENADGCIETLVGLSRTGQASAFHGAWDDWGKILSSFDFLYGDKKTDAQQTRLENETELLETFATGANIHLSRGARQQIELARRPGFKYRTLETLYVGRHHGLPTRCVDWTSNWLTGLFFACRRNFSKPGVVWWMNNDNFTKALERQWPEVYEKEGDVGNDIAEDFISGSERDVLVRLHYPEFMERASSQEAWITLSLTYGVKHDEALSRLGVCPCGRLVVKWSIKQELLRWLDRLGVNGRSLGLGDGCAEVIAHEVAKDVLG